MVFAQRDLIKRGDAETYYLVFQRFSAPLRLCVEKSSFAKRPGSGNFPRARASNTSSTGISLVVTADTALARTARPRIGQGRRASAIVVGLPARAGTSSRPR